jgi:hypothetical protein
MNSMLKMIKFPDHPLKPGDTFTQQVPFTLPMLSGEGNSIETTYKLVSVDGNKANFDIMQNISIKTDIKGKLNIALTGSGTGKMVYDISNNFPSTYTSTANVQVSVKTDKINVSGTLNMNGTMNYTITESK